MQLSGRHDTLWKTVWNHLHRRGRRFESCSAHTSNRSTYTLSGSFIRINLENVLSSAEEFISVSPKKPRICFSMAPFAVFPDSVNYSSSCILLDLNSSWLMSDYFFSFKPEFQILSVPTHSKYFDVLPKIDPRMAIGRNS